MAWRLTDGCVIAVKETMLLWCETVGLGRRDVLEKAKRMWVIQPYEIQLARLSFPQATLILLHVRVRKRDWSHCTTEEGDPFN